MNNLKTILDFSFSLSQTHKISVKEIIISISLFLIVSFVLKFINKILTRKLPEPDKLKFKSVFSYVKYFVFIILFLVILNNNGIKITALLTGAAALLIGVGLALQTLFQDVICGILILIDQTLHINDIIEIDGKIVRVTSINLRTTKAVTIENKVLIIPNHLYLTQILYNWTQNEKTTQEFIMVSVAYGSDVQLVKKILLEACNDVDGLINHKSSLVYFTEFGESSLNFKLVFTVQDSFWNIRVKSDLHFKIDELFRKHNISIPFPQRDVHLYKHL